MKKEIKYHTDPTGHCEVLAGKRVIARAYLGMANLIWTGKHDLILSVGQVVPHEVVGMANYNKNIFVGTGGPEGINKSHFLGAAYGMERMMGRVDTPVRRLFNYASEHFPSHLPIVYVHTVVGRTATTASWSCAASTSATTWRLHTGRARSRRR